jgi:hypothetical protein
MRLAALGYYRRMAVAIDLIPVPPLDGAQAGRSYRS